MEELGGRIHQLTCQDERAGSGGLEAGPEVVLADAAECDGGTRPGFHGRSGNRDLHVEFHETIVPDIGDELGRSSGIVSGLVRLDFDGMMAGEGSKIMGQAGLDLASPVGIADEDGAGGAVAEDEALQDGAITIRVDACRWGREFLPRFAFAENGAQSVIAAPVEIVVRIITIADLRRHRRDALRGIVAKRYEGVDDFRRRSGGLGGCIGRKHRCPNEKHQPNWKQGRHNQSGDGSSPAR